MLASSVGVAASATNRPRDPGITRPIVFTQLPVASPAEKAPVRSGGMLRAEYGDGARLALWRPGRPPAVLTPEFHSAADPDVSFDGERILFAGRKRAGDRWAIWEMSADGAGLHEVIGGPDDLRQPIYLPPIYTLTVDPRKFTDPWTTIACVAISSTDANESLDAPRSTLAVFRTGAPEGQSVQVFEPISFNLSNDMDPIVLPDGRVLYATWQRATLDRGSGGRMFLAGMNPDGTDMAVFSADEGRRIKQMPAVTSDRLVVFVESDAAVWDGAGSLGSVTLRRNLHSYRPIGSEKRWLFHSPSALPGGAILASARPAEGGGTHGVVRLDTASGRFEKVFDDPRHHDIQAKLVAPRTRPDSRSTPVKDGPGEGRLYGLDVYANDLPAGSLRAGGVARVRVIEGLPNRTGESADAKGLPPLARRRLLGTAPVEEDGSFHVLIPANVPVQLQILDEDGLALRSSGWIWARSKGQQGCLGCHEDPELTPRNRFVRALGEPGVRLDLPEERRRSVDFAHDLMPVIESRCVPCHGRDARVRLDGEAAGEPPAGPFNRAYRTLLSGAGSRGEGMSPGAYVHPGRARTSPVIWHIMGRNTARPWDKESPTSPPAPMPAPGGLTDDERRLFIEWIDLGALWDQTPGPIGPVRRAGREGD